MQWSMIHQLNWFDVVIVGIVALSVVISFFRGFLRESVSLVTWIAAILLGLKFAGPLGTEFSGHIANKTAQYLSAFLAIFILVFIVGTTINLIIKSLVSKVGMGVMDSILGLAFGFIRGLIAVAVILMIINNTPFQKEMWYKKSVLTAEFKPLVTWMESFIPSKIQQVSAWISDDKSTDNNEVAQ